MATESEAIIIGVPAFAFPKELCRVHAQSRTCGVTAVVYLGENRNPFRPNDFL
jgi:hypothetical protein